MVGAGFWKVFATMSENLPKEWRPAKSAPRGYWLRRSAFKNSNAHRHEINFRGHLIVLVNLRWKVKRNGQCIIKRSGFPGAAIWKKWFPLAFIRCFGSTSHYSLESTSVSDRGEQSIPYPVTRRLWGARPEGHPGARDAAQIDEWRIIGTGDLSHSVHHTNWKFASKINFPLSILSCGLFVRVHKSSYCPPIHNQPPTNTADLSRMKHQDTAYRIQTTTYYTRSRTFCNKDFHLTPKIITRYVWPLGLWLRNRIIWYRVSCI